MNTDTEQVVVTADWLEAGRSDRGGWSKLQLACIGISWPPPKGWKRSVVGSVISRTDADRFHRLRNRKTPAHKSDLPSHLQDGPTTCKRCQKELPLDEFDDSPKTDRVKKAFCRNCCSELSKEAKASVRQIRQLGPKRVTDGKSYISRNMWLKLLGFASYQEYLGSPLWKDIRKRVYAAKGNDCYLCGNPATELHHNRYHRNDLTGKKLRFIHPICRQCHQSIEFDDGEKQNVKQASRAFKKRRKEQRRKQNDA